MHVLLAAEPGFNWFAAIVGLGSFIAIQWGGFSIITIILVSGLLGIMNGLIFS